MATPSCSSRRVPDVLEAIATAGALATAGPVKGWTPTGPRDGRPVSDQPTNGEASQDPVPTGQG